jgi:hypothetical protein
MWKAILAGTTALTIAGAGLVFAQQIPPTQPGRDAAQQRPRLTPEDRAAFTDARIAALKAGLRLTPDQEKNWPAVESALRERAKQRAEHIAEFRNMQRPPEGATHQGNMIERLRQHADAMATQAAELKRLAEAVDPLYKSLDDGQKQRFARLFRASGPRQHLGPGGMRQMGPDHQMGPDRQMGPGHWQRRTDNMQ